MPETPFSLNRFEHEHSHHYYLPEAVWEQLQGQKSVVLLGSRGTGKTTLLRALYWEEQLTNTLLGSQLKGRFDLRGYVGIYVKLSLFQFEPFRHWPVSDSEYLRASVVSAYIDLLWVEALCDATARLISDRVIVVSPKREIQATGEIIAVHPELFADAQPKARISFAALKTLVFQRRRSLEKLALADSRLSAGALSALFPLVHIGEFGRTCARAVCACLSSATNGRPWRVKVCFDEAECLDPFQQKVINTAIRLCDATLSYVVSYVRSQDEPHATVLPNITLQRADRDVVPLDAIDDSQFLALAEGVSQVRIRACGAQPDSLLNLYELLGRLNINGLLRGILATSEDPEAIRLLALAEQLRGTYEDAEGPEADADVKPPPIYQAYLVDRLKLKVPDAQTSKERRAQDSAELRKRMVAAYLCLSADLGSRVRYAYADMLLQMSDKCVRDFLLQMNEIYRAVDASSVDEFVRSTVPIRLQDEALRRAGLMKREYVPESGVGAPTETLRIVEVLGTMTARLQMTRHKQLGLRSSERGVFVITLGEPKATPARDRILELVIDASDAGFLKMLSRTETEWKFRVHCSLAAAFGFSYRGAYYPVPIRMTDLMAISSEQDHNRRQALIARYEKWIGTDAAEDLPLLKDVL